MYNLFKKLYRKFLKNQLSFFIKEFVSKPQRILSDHSLEIGLNTDLELRLDNIKNKVGFILGFKRKTFLKLQTKIYE